MSLSKRKYCFFQKIPWPSLLVGLVLALLALQHQKNNDYGHWRGLMWGDKVGYYVYLPYLLDYGAVAPESLAARYEELGRGFKVEDAKVITKYPIGVAYLELPFYALARLQALGSSKERHPFGWPYVQWLALAAPFWVSLGLFWLYRAFLISGLSKLNAWGLSLAGLFASSLFYYSSIEGPMSHAFSFSVGSGLLYSLLSLYEKRVNTKLLLSLSLFAVLMVMIRPFNLLLVIFFALSVMSLKSWQLPPLRWPTLLISLGLWSLLLLGPQLWYYRHAYGSWLTDSYEGEHFNFANAHIWELFFSPVQGLFLYVPFFLLLFLLLVRQFILDWRKYLLPALGFVAISYLFASWHSWNFGCGFGIRVFVDLLPLLLLLSAGAWQGRSLLNKGLWLSLGLFIPYNIWLSNRWTGCWFAEDQSLTSFFEILGL